MRTWRTVSGWRRWGRPRKTAGTSPSCTGEWIGESFSNWDPESWCRGGRLKLVEIRESGSPFWGKIKERFWLWFGRFVEYV